MIKGFAGRKLGVSASELFSNFLGFLKDGMEEIIEFSQKLSNRRQRAHRKDLMGIGFAKELTRLDFSINYERESYLSEFFRGRGVNSRGANDSFREGERSVSMNLEIVSLNTRGANDSFKRKVVKALLHSMRADVFLRKCKL